ncbi:MAG: hypothetical protein Q4D34_05965 [Eggerthellaceae bacterium]|nr:hypothetical protein [Eggerthellaceae bacterium]
MLRINASKTITGWWAAAIAVLLSALLLAVMPFSSAYAEASSPSDLENGAYLIDVTMTGGTGKAMVESSAKLEVEDGKAYATLVWSSENYDYMVVDGETIKPITQKPTSQFKVPVSAFDTPLNMIGDTTAMGSPHEIEYQFTFVSSSIQKTTDGDSNSGQQTQTSQKSTSSTDADTEEILKWVTIGSLVVALIAIGITIGVLRSYRKRR